jgi:hypothetical protein
VIGNVAEGNFPPHSDRRALTQPIIAYTMIGQSERLTIMDRPVNRSIDTVARTCIAVE